MCIVMCIDVRIHVMYVCMYRMHGNFEGPIFCEGKSEKIFTVYCC